MSKLIQQRHNKMLRFKNLVKARKNTETKIHRLEKSIGYAIKTNKNTGESFLKKLEDLDKWKGVLETINNDLFSL